jgi:exodeoxyribonuclease V gamma subunit
VRELEVLHDRLLSLFAADASLQPADVLVVMPDLDAAAPLVDAVFGSVPPERHIPFAVTGLPRSRANAPARALLQLLALLASRAPVTEVHGLLQQPLVARRFGLDDDDLLLVHDWLQRAGVHWGLDGAHRARFDVPGHDRHTLADGLARLFLGHALPATAAEPLAGLLPGADIDGGQAPVLGRLWTCVQALRHWHALVQQPQSPAAWARLLRQACDDFLAPEGDERAELRELLTAIAALGDDMQRAGLADVLPLPVLRLALQQRLDDPAHGGVPTGAVTFSALHSLRGLPYRVVCAIGLDDGLFPGAQRPAEFDLMAARPRRGDRQRRHDDRNLFLDLLLAARDHLHLSHTGRSVRDNTPLPPSVLVADLLDLLVPAIAADPTDAASLRAARRRLVVEHPLQPFSVAAFQVDGDPRLRSHDRELAAALQQARAAPAAPPAPAAAPSEPGTDGEDSGDDDGGDDDLLADTGRQAPFVALPLPAPGPEWRVVALEQLVQWLRHPCRYLLRHRLGVALTPDADALQDDEPLVADRAAQWALADRLLPALLAGADRERAWRLATAGTDWPAGRLGEVQLRRELDLLQGFAERVRAATATPPLDPRLLEQPFDLDGETWTLRLTLSGLRPEGLVRWRGAAVHPRDRLDAWVHHLALCAAAPAGVPAHTRWLALDATLRFAPVADASAQLAALLRLYRQGLREPLHFFPRSAWAYLQAGDSLHKARKAWAPDTRHPGAEGADAAYRLALRGCTEPLDADFEDLAHRIYDPLRAHLTEEAA